MATRLKNVVRFTNVAAAAVVVLPHNLNLDERAVIPDEFTPITSGVFTYSIDDTNVTVTNVGSATADVDVYVEYWHTYDRVFGVASQVDLVVKPLQRGRGIVESTAVWFPQIRVEDAPAATRPTIVSAGATLGYIMALNDQIFVEVPLQTLLDRTKNILIGVSWAPTGAEVGRVVTWQINVLPCEEGTNLALAGTAIQQVDVAVPVAAASYIRTGFVVTPVVYDTNPLIDEIHVRISRIASSNDPVADPAIHHIAAIQPLA